MQRLAVPPALLVQCAIDRAGLRPAAGQDWINGGQVTITATNAADFDAWWRGHDTPGPYTETFVIDGHRTHYLSFGAAWVTRNGQWVPLHTAHTDPVAEQESLYGWAAWAALNNKLPPAVCGTSVTAQQLQAQVYGPGVRRRPGRRDLPDRDLTCGDTGPGRIIRQERREARSRRLDGPCAGRSRAQCRSPWLSRSSSPVCWSASAPATSWSPGWERIGERLGLSEALLGVVAALAADAQEITSSISALTAHQQKVGAGVIIGSNVFNLAALLGIWPAVAAGQHRRCTARSSPSWAASSASGWQPVAWSPPRA